MKRKRPDDGLEDQENLLTPTSKRTRSVQKIGEHESVQQSVNTDPVTPSRRARGRPPGSKNKPKDATPRGEAPPSVSTPTQKIKGKLLFSTPKKTKPNVAVNETPPIGCNADRSARRKSARTLIERTITGDLGDDDDPDEEDILARAIWDEDDPEDDELIGEIDEAQDIDSDAPVTPSKRGRVQRKGSRRKRSPTPPQNLPPHEQYFFQNRAGGIKTSHNTLSSLSLLTHEEYFNQIKTYVDPHDPEKAFLQDLHTRSFGQWRFELCESFNLCLYGWGSKRHLVNKFAEWFYSQLPQKPPNIVVVNGYVPTLNARTILTTIATTLLGSDIPNKLGAQPTDILDLILDHLSRSLPSHDLLIIIHSLDAYPLRRSTTQSLLARLASHPHIRLLATCDTPNFPLLWDSSLREQYNFLFHDCTTFAPYDAEINVVDDVHELLGRSGRRVGGKEGVGFVLKSLPENARNLYRVLIGEQLTAMENGLDIQGAGVEDREEKEAYKGGSSGDVGVEYRYLYQKAVEEFICSSEMNFRTLLKEFHDHQMITSKKDVLGTEILSVPFRREELELILEDLTG
ncbi:Origin recognition complex subunit 2 [Acarospora aff. strigata]|nr:Origin recognition complex subunit 2 [Acarospora aff. strigata]